jgi:hypothetical protein
MLTSSSFLTSARPAVTTFHNLRLICKEVAFSPDDTFCIWLNPLGHQALFMQKSIFMNSALGVLRAESESSAKLCSFAQTAFGVLATSFYVFFSEQYGIFLA